MCKDYPKEMIELQKIKHKVQELDRAIEHQTLNSEEIDVRRINCQKMIEIVKMATLDLKQKIRLKWIVDGDENS